MSRQLEAKLEQKRKRYQDDVLLSVQGGLEDAVNRAGGELTGVAIRTSDVECLATIKAKFPGGPMIAFVGGDDIGACLRKGMREGRTDSLRWRADKWG